MQADDLFTYGGKEGMLGVELDNNFKKIELFIFTLRDQANIWVLVVRKITTTLVSCNIVMKWTVAKDFKSVSNRVDIVKDIQFKPTLS